MGLECTNFPATLQCSKFFRNMSDFRFYFSLIAFCVKLCRLIIELQANHEVVIEQIYNFSFGSQFLILVFLSLLLTKLNHVQCYCYFFHCLFLCTGTRIQAFLSEIIKLTCPESWCLRRQRPRVGCYENNAVRSVAFTVSDFSKRSTLICILYLCCDSLLLFRSFLNGAFLKQEALT